jgi:DNA-binding beta-propeller fold protein YncE
LIYLLDLVSGSVQTFDGAGRFISNWTPHCGSRNVITALSSITFDSSGNLYAADRLSRRICKFDRNGQFLTQWDDSAANGSLKLLQGIVVDAQGNVYVAETENDLILKFRQP